jgi:hypothetical protein
MVNPLLGHQFGAHYGQEASEISPQGEQLGMEEVKVVCLSFVLEIEELPTSFQHSPILLSLSQYGWEPE